MCFRFSPRHRGDPSRTRCLRWRKADLQLGRDQRSLNEDRRDSDHIFGERKQDSDRKSGNLKYMTKPSGISLFPTRLDVHHSASSSFQSDRDWKEIDFLSITPTSRTLAALFVSSRALALETSKSNVGRLSGMLSS